MSSIFTKNISKELCSFSDVTFQFTPFFCTLFYNIYYTWADTFMLRIFCSESPLCLLSTNTCHHAADGPPVCVLSLGTHSRLARSRGVGPSFLPDLGVESEVRPTQEEGGSGLDLWRWDRWISSLGPMEAPGRDPPRSLPLPGSKCDERCVSTMVPRWGFLDFISGPERGTSIGDQRTLVSFISLGRGREGHTDTPFFPRISFPSDVSLLYPKLFRRVVTLPVHKINEGSIE